MTICETHTLYLGVWPGRDNITGLWNKIFKTVNKVDIELSFWMDKKWNQKELTFVIEIYWKQQIKSNE